MTYDVLSSFKARSSSHYQMLKHRRTQRTAVVEVKAYHRDFNEVGSSGYGHILKLGALYLRLWRWTKGIELR